MIIEENPLLCENFINWLKDQPIDNKIILEIGSGNSTIFFSKIFKKVISYEDYPDWFLKIKSIIVNNNIENIELNKFDEKILENIKFKKDINNTDYLLIDSSFYSKISRLDFAIFLHLNKNENSIIILDNGELNIDAYEFLRKNYYCIDFTCKRGVSTFSQTSVFFKKRDLLKINKSIL